jgi:site-specific DNA-methyltransferase (adenine-specific)
MKYNIIYADPPWSYKDKNPLGRTRGRYGAADHYQTMTLTEIKELNVQRIAAGNCVLFLWAVAPQLPAAIEVINAWGFQYKTIAFVWIKLEQNGERFFGTGAYTKSNAELCLLGVRGKVGRLVRGSVNDPDNVLRVISNKESQIITTSRKNRSGRFHSVKPDKAYTKIESLFGKVPRIELFARNEKEGWDCWGNQVKSTVKLRPRKS